MKNNLLASIALFGIYRNNNQDTYDLVAQYISAVIAQKEYVSFKPKRITSYKCQQLRANAANH